MAEIKKREENREKIEQYLKDNSLHENDKEHPLEIKVINNSIEFFEGYCNNNKEIDYMRFMLDLQYVYDQSVKGFEDEKVEFKLSFEQLVGAIIKLSDLDEAKNLGSIILDNKQQFFPLYVPSVPSGQAPYQQVLHGKDPSAKAPSPQVSSGQAPSAKAPSGQDPSAKAPSGQVSSGQDPSAKAPSPQVSSGQAPSAKAPSAKAPSAKAPSPQAPSAKAPSGQDPSEQVSSGQDPSAKAPSPQAPSAKAPSGQDPSEQISHEGGKNNKSSWQKRVSQPPASQAGSQSQSSLSSFRQQAINNVSFRSETFYKIEGAPDKAGVSKDGSKGGSNDGSVPGMSC